MNQQNTAQESADKQQTIADAASMALGGMQDAFNVETNSLREQSQQTLQAIGDKGEAERAAANTTLESETNQAGNTANMRTGAAQQELGLEMNAALTENQQ
jgi:hypothetical protein